MPVTRTANRLRNVKGASANEREVIVSDEQPSAYEVTLKTTLQLDERRPAPP